LAFSAGPKEQHNADCTRGFHFISCKFEGDPRSLCPGPRASERRILARLFVRLPFFRVLVGQRFQAALEPAGSKIFRNIVAPREINTDTRPHMRSSFGV
jgi:hypothetical protein